MSSEAERVHQLDAALQMAGDVSRSPAERADMLVEIAMGLQAQARNADTLHNAIKLYERALELVGEATAMDRARILARKATALQALPDDGEGVSQARDIYQQLLDIFEREGQAAECAELQMNLGLVLQTLASAGRAKMPDAIRAYQDALRYFTAEAHPQEYAIIHNNLATAFLSLQIGEPQGRLREALAVQSFEAALAVVTLEDQPLEYAMLQNNLGNALQQVESQHPLENHTRALQAYDEALRVRTRERSPLQYANTLANRAACQVVLAVRDGPPALEAAREGYAQAVEIFREQGEEARAQLVLEVLASLPADLVPLESADQ